MKINRHLLLTAAALTLSSAFHYLSAADHSLPTAELLEKGKKAYLANCLSCHGATGDGNGPAGMYLKPKPRNLGTEAFKNGETPQQVFQTLTTGLKGTAMVAFAHLPEDVRWGLAHYVLTFKKK